MKSKKPFNGEIAKCMDDVFSCKMCGDCCHGQTTVSLSDEDQLRMLEHLQISRRQAFARYWRRSGNVVQMKIRDGHCIFYDNGCTVHQARPFRCREWPLVQAILHDAATLETLRKSCPGIDREVSYEEMCDAVRSGGCLQQDAAHTPGE